MQEYKTKSIFVTKKEAIFLSLILSSVILSLIENPDDFPIDPNGVDVKHLLKKVINSI